jgi:hypothetical protein
MKSSQLKYFGVLAIALLGLLSTTSATSATIQLDAWGSSPTPTIVAYPAGLYSWDLGNVFTSNVNGNVSALGIYAGNGTVFADEKVGLYNSSGYLMAQVTITDSNLNEYDNYYWAPITTTASVVAGDTYVVVNYIPITNGWSYGSSPIPGAALDEHWATVDGLTYYLNVSDLAYTGIPNPVVGGFYDGNTGYPYQLYMGGNVLLSPEPGTMLLLGSGLLGLAGIVRRRFHKS